jgi:hypothetical protein
MADPKNPMVGRAALTGIHPIRPGGPAVSSPLSTLASISFSCRHCRTQFGHRGRGGVRLRGVAPARPNIVCDVGDVLILQLARECRHWPVRALRRDSTQHDPEDIGGVRRDDSGAAGERRKDAGNAAPERFE